MDAWIAINNEFANTRKLKKTFSKVYSFSRQISPFSKDKTFLSKLLLILFATFFSFYLLQYAEKLLDII